VLAFLGLGLGLVGAFLVGRAMHSTLYGSRSIDFAAVSVVALMLLTAAIAGKLAACPPRRIR
jgi:hypothetical protein